MKDTKALNQLADAICRAQANGRRTPMGIAVAIESAQMLMSPEVAAEMHDLRTRLAGLANPPREVFLALYDGAEPELFTTVEAARECCDDLAGVDAHGKCWDWTVNEFGVHVQFWTHPDDDRPLSETSGSVTPVVIQGAEPLPELEQLRARAAESGPAPDAYPPAFPWARWLDAEDLADFLDELAASAITHASSATALAEVEQTCASWWAVAESWRAHLTAPGPDCTCPEPVLGCSGVTCGCPVCHRAVVPAADVPVPYLPADMVAPAVVTPYAEQSAARLRRLLSPAEPGVEQ